MNSIKPTRTGAKLGQKYFVSISDISFWKLCIDAIVIVIVSEMFQIIFAVASVFHGLCQSQVLRF